MRTTIHCFSTIALLFLSSLAAVHAAEKTPPDRFTVHEWGTFTTLQDDAGKELAGVNIDDEPVPRFVHDLSPQLLSPAVLSSRYWAARMKGAPQRHPLVTMRLETPVIYFYPPRGAQLPLQVDVRVNFRGGWLTQFYPAATPLLPLEQQGTFDFRHLTPQTVGGLAWTDLKVGVTGPGPATDELVWLTPRNVTAASIASDNGETEKYLFYRGVGCQRSPLRITTDRKTGQLTFFSNRQTTNSGEQRLGRVWLLHTRQDALCAWRGVDGLRLDAKPDQAQSSVSYRFTEKDFTTGNRARLEAEMHAALVADGLFADEAKALLGTWKWSYFTSAGLRAFYLVPRNWTDDVLPLTVSGQPVIQRVMVGRIELITEEQQGLLSKLAKSTITPNAWLETIPESPAREKFFAGRSTFGDLGVTIPADFQIYLQLGRFRNALLIAEEARRPTRGLTEFINNYQLRAFRAPGAGGDAESED